MKRKGGFTVVEIVIVIAVIAILVAILIPTFSSVISNAKHVKDVSVVTNINKMLSIEDITGKKGLSYEQASAVMERGGYNLPLTPEADGYRFYWIPGEDRIVLFDTVKSAVDSPETHQDSAFSADWVDLSAAHSDTPEPAKPEEEKARTLVSGSSFNALIRELSSEPENIIFASVAGNEQVTKNQSAELSADGGIKAYLDGKNIYVLNNGAILAPSDCSDMFMGMKSLKSSALGNFSISEITATDRMFSGCSALTAIYVTADKSDWKSDKIRSSSEMFDNCVKLPHYSISSSEEPSWIEKWIDGILTYFIPRDVEYANTGNRGYFSLK